jgi:hypothetical protein
MPNMSKNDIEFINQYGGEISHLVECFTVQMFKPQRMKIKDKLKQMEHNQHSSFDKDRQHIPLEDYYPGNIVSYQWLIDMHS